MLYRCFIPFYGKVRFHCMAIPHLFIHSSAAGHLSYFYFLAIANDAPLNRHIQVLT